MQVKNKSKTRTRTCTGATRNMSSWGGSCIDGLMAVPKIDPKAEVIRLMRIQVGQGHSMSVYWIVGVKRNW